MNVNQNSYLAEVKGIREKKGKFRLTQKEFLMANEYKNDYIN
ncbi:protein NO VEIN domain-containing protein [Flavobacterium sp. CG_9.1]